MHKNFDVDELFATSFGIYLTSGRGEKICFRTSTQSASYIRDLPLHNTQVEESNDGEYVTFSIFVCPRDSYGNIHHDMLMEFCKYGSQIEILSPAEIRNAVAEELTKASSLYR